MHTEPPKGTDFRLNVTLDWKARAEAAEARVKVLEEAGEMLRREATMLCQNAMACAVNHYGEDFAQHGMPRWLADSQARIQSATAALGAEHGK